MSTMPKPIRFKCLGLKPGEIPEVHVWYATDEERDHGLRLQRAALAKLVGDDEAIERVQPGPDCSVVCR